MARYALYRALIALFLVILFGASSTSAAPAETTFASPTVLSKNGAQITPSPSLEELKKRVEAMNTCAYIGGLSQSPLSCPDGYTCTLQAMSIIACCNSRGACVNAAHTCFNHLEAGCPFEQSTICEIEYTSWTQCPATAPYCTTYTSSNPTGFGYGDLTSFACGPKPSTISIATAILDPDSTPSETSEAYTFPFASTSTSDLFATSTSGTSSDGSTSSSSSGDSSGGNGAGRGLSAGEWGGIAVGIIFGVLSIVVAVISNVYKDETKRFLNRWVLCGCRGRGSAPGKMSGSGWDDELTMSGAGGGELVVMDRMNR